MTDVSILNCGPIIEGLERDLGLSVETISLALDVDRRTVETEVGDHSGEVGVRRQRAEVAQRGELTREVVVRGADEQ